MQTAVFVDAGYLLAQGGVLLAKAKVLRQNLILDAAAVAALLAELAHDAAPEARLLRIYWYDGLVRGGNQTVEHVELARTANIKLRLGMVNSRGQQKGVDSLIVTDMIELARNGSISDAVLLSGDEDVRVGLQVAQTFGVRVQLVGVKPALGSQSPDLIAEADTLAELDELRVRRFLKLKPAEAASATRPPLMSPGTFIETAQRLASALVAELGDKRAALAVYMDANRGALSSDFDRPALAKLRDTLERDIDDEERKTFRAMLRTAVKAS